jgi:hypothetical protein
MLAGMTITAEHAAELAYCSAINATVNEQRRRNPPRLAVHVLLAEGDPQYAEILAEHDGDEDAALDELNAASDEPQRCYSRRERAMRYAERAGGYVLERFGLRWTVGPDGWGEWEWDEELLLAADTGRPFGIVD